MNNSAQQHFGTKAPQLDQTAAPTAFALVTCALMPCALVPYALVTCALMTCALFTGCQSTSKTAGSAAQKVGETTPPKEAVQSRLEQSQLEIERLNKQIETLSRLSPDKRADALYHLQALKIGRYTNIYDDDKDGAKDKLIVYVQPIDEAGDSIKAAGAVDVQLWDLQKTGAEAVLGQWRIEPNDLKKLWFESLIAGSYRLTFDVSSVLKPAADQALTVKVSFTDYLSGRIFTEQKPLKP